MRLCLRYSLGIGTVYDEDGHCRAWFDTNELGDSIRLYDFCDEAGLTLATAELLCA